MCVSLGDGGEGEVRVSHDGHERTSVTVCRIGPGVKKGDPSVTILDWYPNPRLESLLYQVSRGKTSVL